MRLRLSKESPQTPCARYEGFASIEFGEGGDWFGREGFTVQIQSRLVPSRLHCCLCLRYIFGWRLTADNDNATQRDEPERCLHTPVKRWANAQEANSSVCVSVVSCFFVCDVTPPSVTL